MCYYYVAHNTQRSDRSNCMTLDAEKFTVKEIFALFAVEAQLQVYLCESR